MNNIGLTRLGIKSESSAPKPNALATQLSELFKDENVSGCLIIPNHENLAHNSTTGINPKYLTQETIAFKAKTVNQQFYYNETSR